MAHGSPVVESGSVWESNPLRAFATPAAGFEDQARHQPWKHSRRGTWRRRGLPYGTRSRAVPPGAPGVSAAARTARPRAASLDRSARPGIEIDDCDGHAPIV